MPDEQSTLTGTEQKQRLLGIFARLLPLLDSLADKLRLFLVLGVLVVIWLVTWCFYLKHFSIAISAAVGIAALLPTAILARFWWAVEELKSLPDIAGDMMGDAKTELQASVQAIRAGKAPKLGFFSAGRTLWSVGGMTREIRELAGTYLSVATLANPLMLILGVVSLAGVFLLFLVGIVLAFFI